MRLQVIIALQLLALIFGLFNMGYYRTYSFPTLAMVLWGGGATIAMLYIRLIGFHELLRTYGVRGSILLMLGVNILLMVSRAYNK